MTALVAAAGPLQVFIVQLLAFAGLLFVLWRFVRPALARLLGERTRSFEEAFRKAEEENARVTRELAEARDRLDRVEEEARRRLDQVLEEARQTRDRVLAEAREQVQAALDKARREAAIERDKAVLELREEAARLTLAAAEHLVRSVMNDSLQESLVERYLARLEEIKKP